MIRVVYPGILIFPHPGSRIPDVGVKKAPDRGSGSATPIFLGMSGFEQRVLP
jgi:hypothetical protein